MGAQLGFYRTAAGAEMDVVVQAGQRSLGIEVKFSSAPTVGKGFWQARSDLKPQRTVVVAPVERRYPLKDGVDVVPVSALDEVLAELD
jgi:predicted AAA+ superfamily ATPase